MSRRHRDLNGSSRTETAAYWFVRNDAGDLSESDRHAFEQWLACEDNRKAYRDVLISWSAFDAADSDVTVQSMRRVALTTEREPRRKVWSVAAGVAVIVVAGLVATIAWRESPLSVDLRTVGVSPDDAGQVEGVRYSNSTAAGGLKNVELADGTRVVLNADTVLYVSYSAEERLIALVRGQAYFEVARDSERPFVVEAHQRRVTALGTSFEVEFSPERFRVLLVEGSVRVEPREARLAAVGALGSDIVLASGQGLVAEVGSTERIVEFDVGRALMWRDGYVEFDDEPLGDVLVEMNRYFAAPVVLRESGATDLRVSGIFRTFARDEFLAIITELLPVRVHTDPADAGEPVELVPY